MTTIGACQGPIEVDAATVILTHINPIEGGTVSVTVAVDSIWVEDTFERTSTDSWGMATNGLRWKARGAAGIAGGVSDGAGHLDVSGVNGARIDLWANVIDLFAVGHFSDCTNDDDQVIFDVGSQIFLSSGGQLHDRVGTSVALTDFDACSPWFIRLEQVGEDMTAKVWQATEPEPESAQLTVPSIYLPARLEIDTVGLATSPTREFILDWVDFEVQTTT